MMIYAGIDIGSQSTCAVLLNKERVVSSSILPSGVHPDRIGNEALSQAIEKGNCPRSEIGFIVATGYGRYQVQADERVSEITCQARGVYWYYPEARMILDIGGQDSKIILLGKKGKVIDFMMNDKCAAGTGRFLELMTHVLDIHLDDYGRFVNQSQESIELSNTCAIFAESELVSLIAQGKKREDLARAICRSVVKRVLAMAEKIGITHPLVFTGGVAQNEGVISILKHELNFSPIIPPDPLITAALGAAIIAREKSTLP
jgi:predicted CoA-substrate-specific enzyme activase